MGNGSFDNRKFLCPKEARKVEGKRALTVSGCNLGKMKQLLRSRVVVRLCRSLKNDSEKCYKGLYTEK